MLAVMSTSSTPFYYRHVPKNILLLILSLITLPLSLAIVFLSFVYTRLNPPAKPLHPRDGDASRKTILVTGVSMTKGLTIAQLLAQHTPHRIIGADTSPLSPGRFSKSLSKFYRLTPPDGQDTEPYIDSLLEVIKSERVDLWVSCSSVVAAVEDGEVVRLAEQAASGLREFKAIQFREDLVEKLHEKDKFISFISSLGLRTPVSHRCTSTQEVLDVLLQPKIVDGAGQGDKKWILKPIGVNDRARGNMMTLLPFPSAAQTTSYVKSLEISPSNPFQLQQYIDGREYCTYSLVIRGRVVAFCACPSSDLLMHYEALPPDSRLSRGMLAFTEKVAEDGGENFTGHLSFDFLANGEGEEMELYPIECNPRAHTAVVLFQDTPQLAGAYLSALGPDSELDARELVVPRGPPRWRYWIGHDLVTLVILPLLDLLWGVAAPGYVFDSWAECYRHVVGWKEGAFAVWDPVPFLVLYHVYWPVQLAMCLLKGEKWSRVNVSTTKVFRSA